MLSNQSVHCNVTQLVEQTFNGAKALMDRIALNESTSIGSYEQQQIPQPQPRHRDGEMTVRRKKKNIDVSKAFFGVQLRNILGNASNCGEFTGNVCKTLLPSIVIGNLSVGRLYGVMICGVIDGRNLTFPRVDSGEKRFQVRANRLQIDDNDYLPVPQATIPWGVFGALALALSGSAVFLCCAWRRRERKIRLLSKMMQRSQQEVDQRYTELPRNDLWELGRRNLIIYDDKKLGSGAFGAVFLGRLIGVAKGSKDAQSTLGVNLMRADNCDVAVKMLPEYADEVSKSEFLREISLMKTLGYHERLVNMLACVTKSEPYCLVVEYCADGDLLHFLKERCNYMLKLDEENVDYASEGCQQSFDADMVMTVKQLLQFSVQISYGLEYLSQKGFVHRDVAARNILVHDKHYAKIGDFGLCRYIYADSVNYQGKGGRLPVKWMPPEAIRHYQFTTKSDVWSFGILMFEIITLGGTPYPGLQPDDLLDFLEAGGRIGQPDNCPDKFYAIMKSCWAARPSERPEFSAIRQQLALQLEEITDEYSYLRLDAQKDYYNVADRERLEQEGKQQAVSTSDELKVESASTEQVQ